MDKNAAEVATKALDLASGFGGAIGEAVTQLASKLGVTASHVYEVLVRQAIVEAWVIIAFTPALAAIAYASVRWWKAAKDKAEGYATKNEVTYIRPNPFQESVDASTVAASLSCILLFAYVAFGVTSAAMRLFNPEYYAIKEVAKIASGIVGK